jgi:N-acetylglucosamine kinase-like BadF-type ATPase
MMGLLLGIDGGGTRTTAWLADENGKVLGRGRAGPSNPHKVGMRAATREILKAALAARRAAGTMKAGQRRSRAAILNAVCAGISGVDRPVVHDPLLEWMRRHLPARRYVLTTDAAIALAAAVGDSPGIMVIAGTGSIALARDDRGRILRAGGWGVPFDDLGSGFELGRRAVTVALQAFDGRGPRTRLLPRVTRALGLGQITDVVPKKLQPQEIAALAPLVMDAARRGDVVACHLCDEAARDLAELAAALLKRAGWMRRSVPVVSTGGIFQSSLLIQRSFARQLRRIAPFARLELLDRPPVEGALWLARKAVGGEQKAVGSRQ